MTYNHSFSAAHKIRVDLAHAPVRHLGVLNLEWAHLGRLLPLICQRPLMSWAAEASLSSWLGAEGQESDLKLARPLETWTQSWHCHVCHARVARANPTAKAKVRGNEIHHILLEGGIIKPRGKGQHT